MYIEVGCTDWNEDDEAKVYSTWSCQWHVTSTWYQFVFYHWADFNMRLTSWGSGCPRATFRHTHIFSFACNSSSRISCEGHCYRRCSCLVESVQCEGTCVVMNVWCLQCFTGGSCITHHWTVPMYRGDCLCLTVHSCPLYTKEWQLAGDASHCWAICPWDQSLNPLRTLIPCVNIPFFCHHWMLVISLGNTTLKCILNINT